MFNRDRWIEIFETIKSNKLRTFLAGFTVALGILIFVGIYFYLSDRIFLSVLFICLGASFHPTYVLHSGFLISGILIFPIEIMQG